MNTRTVLTVAVLISLVALGTWFATGRHFYTKYEVVETVAKPVDADDPLAGTGFYDDEEAVTATVHKDEFHLGLLPTPAGLFDKHMLSVASILGVTWGVTVPLVLWRRRRERALVHPQ